MSVYQYSQKISRKQLEKKIHYRESFILRIVWDVYEESEQIIAILRRLQKIESVDQKNRYSLSLTDETLTNLRKTKYFIKLNIRQTFHRIRITNVESENLTTFKIRFDVYKYRVLSFNLCDELVTYQHYINNVFFDYLNNFVFVYINDILIYKNFKKNT